MASESGKSAASFVLLVNVVLYLIVIVIAAWAVNNGIERSREVTSIMSLPARIFPIYHPFGNMATSFVVICSLIAGVVGFTTSIIGLHNLFKWNAPNLHAAAASSLLTLLLTLLAMGMACKEIEIGWIDSDIRALEIVLIVVSATQLFCTAAIHIRVADVVSTGRNYT
ncbi:UNVERIFIED_CONTAM: Membrane protein PM19L [Sesamum calycinum]|uniref:Membrane protein PM19L n=1 Tax=Sesamum calycinum TaxID=2727403 RepID=A0AAW2QJU0_9LAMI